MGTSRVSLNFQARFFRKKILEPVSLSVSRVGNLITSKAISFLYDLSLYVKHLSIGFIQFRATRLSRGLECFLSIFAACVTRFNASLISRALAFITVDLISSVMKPS